MSGGRTVDMRWKSALLVIVMRFFPCYRSLQWWLLGTAGAFLCMSCGKGVDEWWVRGGYAVEKCFVGDCNAFLHNVDNLWTSRV